MTIEFSNPSMTAALMEERIARKEAVNAAARVRMELDEAATDLAAARQTILRMEQEADALRKERDAYRNEAEEWRKGDRDNISEWQARAEAAEAKVTRLREALEIIAGVKDMTCSLASDAEIARAALETVG